MDNILAKIKPKVPRCSSLVIYSSDTKTIPFTVPMSAPPYGRRCDSIGESGRSSSCDSQPGTPPVSHRDSRSASPRVGGEPFYMSDTRGAAQVGHIDPSLYKNSDVDENYEIPPGHIGRIWFAIEYERETEKLHVTLIRGRHLPSRSHTSLTACDPFFKINLLPDERRYLQTKFKKKTCNPKYEESFVFPISFKILEERVLKFTAYDVDRNRRHQVIGHALYPLKEHTCEGHERVVIWRDLEKDMAETTLEKGEVNVSLCYNDNMERLTVAVFEGKNFCTETTANLADFYLKVCLLQQSKVIKSKKTDTVKRTHCPVFNESFIFKVSQDDLEAVSVSITAMQYYTGQKDKQVGRITLGSFMFARGKELEHWNEMISNTKDPVIQWHTFT